MKQISEEEKPFTSLSVDISLKDDITLGSSFTVISLQPEKKNIQYLNK
jgi:hypothetical protein